MPYTDCVRVALQLLVLIAKGTTIPSDAIADLWPPVWAWIDLQCRYIRWEPDDQFQLAAIHIAVISRLGLTPGPKTGKTAVHPSIDSTPGLRFDLMCAWKWILPHDMAESKSVFALLLQVLTWLINVENPDHFEEIIAGAGGELRDLSTILIAQLNRFAANVDLDVQGQLIFLHLLHALLGHTELHDDFLTAGLITALVNLVNGRMQNLKKIHRNFPETCFDVLTKSLRVAPGSPGLSRLSRPVS
jgi:hypothetical protein